MSIKVKLLVSRVGADGAQNRNDEIVVSVAEAKRMIEAGQAVPVASEKREKTIKRAATEKRA